MGKFLLTISSSDLFTQVAALINIGEQLHSFVTPYELQSSPIRYIVELDRDKVIGVMGLHQHGAYVTELKHLRVHPNYRRQGLGKKLLEKGIIASPTPFVYGAVRSDNPVNIRNNIRVGMTPIGKLKRSGYFIIIFARRKNSGNVYKGYC